MWIGSFSCLPDAKSQKEEILREVSTTFRCIGEEEEDGIDNVVLVT